MAPSGCHAGLVSCTASGPVCDATATLPDGAACGGTGVCSAGTCVDRGATRTIEGAFQTVYRPDDGSSTTVAEPRAEFAAASAVLVQDGSAAGYVRFPITVAADGTFFVPGAPVGAWYLQFDQEIYWPDQGQPSNMVPATYTTLVPMYASRPDLTSVLAARPDLARVTASTPVTIAVSGIQSSGSVTRVFGVASQADFYVSMLIPAGATSHEESSDWAWAMYGRLPGLPDAARGDSVVWYERGDEPWSTPAGAGRLKRALRFAYMDDLTLAEGQTATIPVALADAPQTGALDVDVATSAFAALTGDVGPQAQLSRVAAYAQASPRAVAYPDRPNYRASLLDAYLATAADVHLAAPYGQFLGAGWAEMQTIEFLYEANVDGMYLYASTELQRSAADMPAAISGPDVSPPTDLRINGQYALAPIPAVGFQPTLSWSAPRVGTATSYLVTIEVLGGVAAAGDTAGLSAVVDGTSFRVPPGFLAPSTVYYARVAARHAPWDGPGRLPLREGTPLSFAEALTYPFYP